MPYGESVRREQDLAGSQALSAEAVEIISRRRFWLCGLVKVDPLAYRVPQLRYAFQSD